MRERSAASVQQAHVMKTKDSGAQNWAKRKRRMEDVKMSEYMEQFVKKTKVSLIFPLLLLLIKRTISCVKKCGAPIKLSQYLSILKNLQFSAYYVILLGSQHSQLPKCFLFVFKI